MIKEIKIRVSEDVKDQLMIMAKGNNESLNEYLNSFLKDLIVKDQLSKVDSGVRRQLDEISKTLEVLAQGQNDLQDTLLAMIGLEDQVTENREE